MRGRVTRDFQKPGNPLPSHFEQNNEVEGLHMYRRILAAAAVCMALAACASAPPPCDARQAIDQCQGSRDAGACRQLAMLLANGEVPRTLGPDAEEAMLKACWADSLVDAKRGTDARWRLCYEAGKHFSARAVKTLEEPDTNFRKVAAHLYLRACELGQPQGCRLLLSECLLLNESMCDAPPTEDQARQWATQRRERDARALER